jgi:predicted nuclease with TOPRIM domain
MELRIKEKKIDDGRFGFFGTSTLLLTPFAKIAAAILSIGLISSLGVATFKIIQVKNLEIELLELKQDNQRLDFELSSCNSQINRTNEELVRIQAEAQNDLDEINRVNEQLNDLTKRQEREINELKDLPAPVGCEESRAWLKDNLDIFENEK